MKKITINKEYIPLVQLLKKEDFISSGGEVKYFLEENLVLLNDIKVFEKRKKIRNDDILKINDQEYKVKVEN